MKLKCVIKDLLQNHHKINLNKCVKVLLAFHLLFFCTFILDLIEPLEIYSPFVNINLICKLLNWFIECIPVMNEEGTVIASLLVVWTFITAVMIFYMEKKDQYYYGLRQWEIVLFDISNGVKRSFFLLFFIELLVLMIAPFIKPWITITYFCILYPITAACVLAFVGWVTGDTAIQERYISLVKDQCGRGCPISGSLNKDIPALYVYLKNIPDFEKKDWDQVLEILTEAFVQPWDTEDNQRHILTGKQSYETVYYILKNSTDTAAKKEFLKKLASLTERGIKGSQHSVDILTALLFPGVEIRKDRGSCYYITALSAIESDEIRQELLMRGVVYTYCLEYDETGYRYDDYSDVRKELYNRAAEEDKKKNKSYIVNFALRMKNLDSRFRFVLTDIADLLA